MESTPRTIQQVVASNVRRLREVRGVSQDDVARAAQLLGAPWRQTTVGDVEKLRRLPTVETLVVLAAAFTLLDDGAPVSPSDLLEHDGPVEMTSGAWLPAEAVREMLRGRPGFLLHGAADASLSYREAVDRYRRDRPKGPDRPRDDSPLYVLADERAAQRLGIDDATAEELMLWLWGETLSSRSARLAAGPDGEQPNAQRKGIVTRRLTQELSEGFELRQALEAAEGAERAAELWEETTPEQREALARSLARRRAGATGRAIRGHLGLNAAAAEAAAERDAVDGVPWVSEELLARLEEEADRGDGQ